MTITYPIVRPSLSFVDGFGHTAIATGPEFWMPSDPRPPYTGRQRYGFILCAHSYGQTGGDIKTRFNLSRIHSGGKGYWILAPDGLPSGGDGQNRFNYWDPTANDFARFKAFADALITRLDPLYVAWLGYSNGGLFGIQFALQYVGYLGAAVTIAAAGGDRDPTSVASTPTPWLHIHGTSDTLVLPAGDPTAALTGTLAGHGGADYGSGQSTGYTSVTTTVANLAARNGLSGSLGAAGAAFDLVGTPAGNEATARVWDGSQARVNKVEYWELASATHALTASANNELILQWIDDNARLRS